MQDLVEELSKEKTWYTPKKVSQQTYERNADGSFAGYEEEVSSTFSCLVLHGLSLVSNTQLQCVSPCLAALPSLLCDTASVRVAVHALQKRACLTVERFWPRARVSCTPELTCVAPSPLYAPPPKSLVTLIWIQC